MNEYKKPKLFGKDEDGKYLGEIEEIQIGQEFDILNICNRAKKGFFYFLFGSGYRQIGTFKLQPDFARSNVPQFNKFNENDLVIVTKKDNQIIEVVKDEEVKNAF